MRRESIIRLTFLLLLVSGIITLGTAYATSPVRESTSAIQKAHQQGSNVQIAPERDNATLIVSDRRFQGQVESAVIVFAPSGSVMSYQGSIDNYQDSDPLPSGRYSFFILASDRLPKSECPPDLGCSDNIFQTLNASTNEVKTFYVEQSNSSGSKDWHDVDRINETHYVVADIAEDSVFIVNVSSGEHVWTWEVESEFDPSSGGDYEGDWTHMNDVEHLPDGRIMANLRNQDQVVFIQPGEGLQEDWTLGQDDNHDIVFEPHNPDYIPEANGGPAVLIADSENNRIVEYQRDRGRWELTWVWKDDEMRWPRDADRLPNGHTLITDSNRGRVFEVNERGDIVWQVNTSMPYEAERIGTGPESEGGPSAVSANLTSVASGGVLPENQTRSGLKQYGDGSDGVSDSKILTSITENPSWSYLTNSLLFISPAWMDLEEIYVLLGMLLLLTIWSILELYWSPLSVDKARDFIQRLPH